MNFFNIDLHVSVIADLKSIFSKLGHTITDKSLSGHTWVFNRRQDSVRLINQHNWRGIDKSLCDKFYNEYRNELKEYDGFICTYPPAFSLLYEKFNKPIILQVPIRFEVPFENRPTELKWFIDFLRRGIDSNQIIPVCNSLYEKKYCEKYTDREWILIPNICDYAGIKYEGGENYVLYSHVQVALKNPTIKDKDEYLGFRYQWKSLNKVKGIVHLPYNASTMSIFEQYTGNIPLLFPTLDFNMSLYKSGITLSELSWNQNKQDSSDWIALSDYYNKEWMPYITYFSSFDDLNKIAEALNVGDISNKMRGFNLKRKQRIYDRWKTVLNGNCKQ